jgi:hypothetical protein
MEIIHEEWRAVKGYEDHYEVSNLGRVRSLPRIVVRRGKPMRCAGKILECNVTSTSGPGYPVVRIGNRTTNVHRLVLETFVGPRPEGCEACHCNGIRTDNRSVNLRWDTPRSNQMDRAIHGTSNRGERCGTSLLSASQVLEIRESSERGCDLAARFGVAQQTICAIRKGRSWTHLQTEAVA